MDNVKCGSRDGEHFCLAGHLEARLREVEGERDEWRGKYEHLADVLASNDHLRARAENAEQRVQANEDAYRDCTRANGDLQQRVAELEAALHSLWETVRGPGATMDTSHLSPSLRRWLAAGGDAALAPPLVAPCGVHGCTLPKTHDDEPHSWEPPTGQGIERSVASAGKCPDALKPDGLICPRCGGAREFTFKGPALARWVCLRSVAPGTRGA